MFIGNQHSLNLLDKVRSRCPSVRVMIQADGTPVEGALQYRKALESVSSNAFQERKSLAEDTAIIYFTSGTTGLPKMVVHTQVSYPLGASLHHPRILAD